MSKQTTVAGDLLVRIGRVVFLVGAAGTSVTVAPLPGERSGGQAAAGR